MGKLNQVPYVPQECGYNRITTVHTEERLSISSTESLSSLSACTVGDLDTGLDNDPLNHSSLHILEFSCSQKHSLLSDSDCLHPSCNH